LVVASQDVEQGPRTPLEDAEVCEVGTSNCVFTDATGNAVLRLPANLETSYTVEKAGHGPFLIGEVIPEGGQQYNLTMATLGHLADQFDRVMSPYPMRDTGTVILQVDPAFGGATFELDDATGKPFYHDEEGRRDPNLTETTSYGFGGFVEVSPGEEFQVNLGGTANDCVPLIGWPGNDENSVRFPIREGYVTVVTMSCPLP